MGDINSKKGSIKDISTALEQSAIPIKHLLIKRVLIDFSLTVKATTVIFISGRGSVVSTAKEGSFIYHLVKS